MAITDFLLKPHQPARNPARPLAKGAVALYAISEQAGTLKDLSGNGYDLTPTATLGYSTGAAGRAVTLGNLANAKRTVASGLDPIANLTNWTLACRVRIDSNTNNSLLFGYVSSSAPFEQYSWWVKADHTFMEADGIGQAENLRTTTVAATDGRWHILVATYDHANVRLYIDGALISTTAVVGLAPGLAGTLTIGPTASGNFAAGQVDFAGLWSRAISPTEVGQLTADPFAMVRRRKLDPAILAAVAPASGGGPTFRPVGPGLCGNPLVLGGPV